MAWARQPDAPQLPACPLEVLQTRPYDYKSLADEYILQTLGGLVGFFGPCIINNFYRRPYFAGIWTHIICGVSLSCIGLYARDFKYAAAARKDEALRQYISLHPEDFPPYERKLYKHILRPWHPIR